MRFTFDSNTGAAVHVDHDGPLDGKHMVLEVRPVEPGERYPKLVNYVPTSEMVPYLETQTTKVVAVYHGFADAPIERLHYGPDGVPMSGLPA